MPWYLLFLVIVFSCSRDTEYAGGTAVDNPPDLPLSAFVQAEIIYEDSSVGTEGKVYVFKPENPYAPVDSFSYENGVFSNEFEIDSAEIFVFNFIENGQGVGKSALIRLTPGDTLTFTQKVYPYVSTSVRESFSGIQVYTENELEELKIPFLYLQPKFVNGRWEIPFLKSEDLNTMDLVLELVINGELKKFAIREQNGKLVLELIDEEESNSNGSNQYDTLDVVWEDVSFNFAGSSQQMNLQSFGDSIYFSFWNSKDSLESVFFVKSDEYNAEQLPLIGFPLDGSSKIWKDSLDQFWVVKKLNTLGVPVLYSYQDSFWVETFQGENFGIHSLCFNFQMVFSTEQIWFAFVDRDLGLRLFSSPNQGPLEWVERSIDLAENNSAIYYKLEVLDNQIYLSERGGTSPSALQIHLWQGDSEWLPIGESLHTGNSFGVFSSVSNLNEAWVVYTDDSIKIKIAFLDLEKGVWEEISSPMPKEIRDVRKAEIFFDDFGNPILALVLYNPEEFYAFVYKESSWKLLPSLVNEGIALDWSAQATGGFFWLLWKDVRLDDRPRIRKIKIP